MLDVAVLGGGLIGCAIARLLAREGRRVAIFERRGIGGEASGAAVGLLGVQADCDDEFMLRLGQESQARYPALLEAVREETGVVVEYWRQGTLQVAFSPAEAALLAARLAWQSAAGASAQQLSATELRALEPQLNPRLTGGVLFPLDGRLDNRALTIALGRAAAAAGCTLREGEEVRSVIAEGGRVAGITTASGRVPCAAVVNAMGAWAARVQGVTPLPVHPVRGQIAVLQAARAPFRHAVASARGYVVARRDGRLLLGSTLEPTGFEKRVTAGGLAGILAAGLELAPRLGRLPLVDSWSGLRPGSADGRPIVSADPALRGYVVASGHFRNGVLLAPLTAELVAALLRGERTAWHAPLSIERFATRAAIPSP